MRRAIRVASAVFLDSARAFRTSVGFDTRAQADAGAGLRIAIPAAGVLRMDIARGLRDGDTALSFGWSR